MGKCCRINVLNSVEGWKITGKRIRAGAQEIDLSVANISLDDELWQMGAYILIECKNWKSMWAFNKLGI